MDFTWTIVALVVVMAIAWRFLGSYMVSVYEGRTRWLSLIERPFYRIIGVDPELEQSWQRYGASVVVFSGVALTSYVLGVTPASPGYATWQVAPQPGSLGWAEGAVPTPHGHITVKWASSPAGFVIAIQAPGGTTGTVVLPKGASRYSVTVNGKPVPVASGHATVSVR